MATIPNLLQLPVRQNPTFLSPLSSRGFIVPIARRHRFSNFSTAVISSSSVNNFRPLVAAGPLDSALEEANSETSDVDSLPFGSGYNVQIFVEEDEPEESVLRRFRREVSKAGIIQECKRRRFFENKQEKKKRKKREASRRNRRRRSTGTWLASSSSQETNAAKKVSDDLDDNWEYYDVDLPC